MQHIETPWYIAVAYIHGQLFSLARCLDELYLSPGTAHAEAFCTLTSATAQIARYMRENPDHPSFIIQAAR